MEDITLVRIIFQNIIPFLPVTDRIKPVNSTWVRIYKSSPIYDLMKSCKGKSFSKSFRKVCKNNNKWVIDFFTEKAHEKIKTQVLSFNTRHEYDYKNYRDDGIYGAAKGGHLDLIKLFIVQGCSHWDNGLKGALRGKKKNIAGIFCIKLERPILTTMLEIVTSGYMAILEYFFMKFVLNDSYFRDGIVRAIQTEQRNMIDFFIKLNPTDNVFRAAMSESIFMGKLDLVELFYDRVNNKSRYLRLAAYHYHKNIVNFFLSKGHCDPNEGLYGAMKGGHGDLVELFQSLGANNWNKGFLAAIRGERLDMIKLAISKGVEKFNKGFLMSVERNNLIITEFFLLKENSYNLKKALKIAIDRKNNDMIRLLKKYNPTI